MSESPCRVPPNLPSQVNDSDSEIWASQDGPRPEQQLGLELDPGEGRGFPYSELCVLRAFPFAPSSTPVRNERCVGPLHPSSSAHRRRVPTITSASMSHVRHPNDILKLEPYSCATRPRRGIFAFPPPPLSLDARLHPPASFPRCNHRFHPPLPLQAHRQGLAPRLSLRARARRSRRAPDELSRRRRRPAPLRGRTNVGIRGCV